MPPRPPLSDTSHMSLTHTITGSAGGATQERGSTFSGQHTTASASTTHFVPDPVTPAAKPGRALGAICLAVVLIVADNTIVNVALPTLSTQLDATTSALQWMVDSYLLVFAGLLLPCGAIGDRFGRRRALLGGLLLLGLSSTAAATMSSIGGLIACRVLMGMGAALAFPATLSLVMSTYPSGPKRRMAVSIWSATVGVGVIIGPLLGGYLLEHAWWGSVFLIGGPVALVATVLARVFVAESKDDTLRPQDLVGAILSFAVLTTAVFAIIEGPTRGWTHVLTLGAAAAAIALGAVFVQWERRHRSPMLPLWLLGDRRFLAPVAVLTLATLALFGFVFVATQYFQIVAGLGPFESGLRYLPFAFGLIALAVLSPKLVSRFGPRIVVTAGMIALGLSMAGATTLGADSGFAPKVIVIVSLLGIGMGLVTSPATELLMDRVPIDRTGIGSSMNDAARQVGGALGVAVLGSAFSAVYRSSMLERVSAASLGTPAVDDRLRETLLHSPGLAGRATAQLGDPALAGAVTDAFLDAMRSASWWGAGFALAGAIVAYTQLPSGRSRSLDSDASVPALASAA
jgi:EmrB/QacA subfamily drug resistance transporter